jgi:foldase protein PrsA
MWIRRLSALAAALLAGTGLIACGGGASEAAAVRVGRATITSTMVDHWMSVTAGGRTLSIASQQHQRLRQQVLEFLISSGWLLGEAAVRGVKVSGLEVAQRLGQKQRAAYPGGTAEINEFAKETGQTNADMMYEVEVELTAARLRQKLTSKARTITEAQVASYYRRNKQSFATPERREVETTNRKTAAQAKQVRREVEAGRVFATTKIKHLLLERPIKPISNRKDAREHAALEKAVYSVRPNVLVGPIKMRFDYFLFKVKRIIPGRQPTLAQVKPAIRKRLLAEQQRLTLAAFITQWRQKWIAQTNCSPAYVVQKCKQYVGAKTAENPLTFS